MPSRTGNLQFAPLNCDPAVVSLRHINNSLLYIEYLLSTRMCKCYNFALYIYKFFFLPLVEFQKHNWELNDDKKQTSDW